MLTAMLAYERGLPRIYPMRAKRDVPNRAASRAADGPRRSARVCVAAPLLLTWAFTACVNSDVALHVVFDVPNGPLDPAQATTVDLVLHHSDGTSLSRTAQLKGGSLDFGTLPLDEAGAISATFRAAGAAMVGYGRVATPVRIRDGGEVAIPIRRPMVYLAAATQAADGDPATSDPWALAKSVVADLSPGAGDLDGQLRLDVQATDFVSVGPHLYAVEQPLLADGQLAGALSLVRFAATNHAVAERFTVPVVGALTDVVGTDDGDLVVIATSEGVWSVDIETRKTTKVFVGGVDRVAVSSTEPHQLWMLQNRVAALGRCGQSSTLHHVELNDGASDVPRVVVTAPIADVATAFGRTFYADPCSSTIYETNETARVAPGVAGPTGGNAVALRAVDGMPVALVANAREVFVAVERNTAERVGVLSLALDGSTAPRVVWGERAIISARTTEIPSITRSLTAETAHIDHLALIGDGEYLALRTAVHAVEPRPPQTNVPAMTADADRVWVIAAANGAVHTRYLSWCGLDATCRVGDVCGWSCSAEQGELTPVTRHRTRALAASFGQR